MAEKATAKEKKAPAKKTVSSAKKPAAVKKKVNKGDTLVCGVCGLSVVVDECGNVYEQELICCGKPMKQSAKKAHTSAK